MVLVSGAPPRYTGEGGNTRLEEPTDLALLELQTKAREDLAITENTPTMLKRC